MKRLILTALTTLLVSALGLLFACADGSASSSVDATPATEAPVVACVEVPGWSDVDYKAIAFVLDEYGTEISRVDVPCNERVSLGEFAEGTYYIAAAPPILSDGTAMTADALSVPATVAGEDEVYVEVSFSPIPETMLIEPMIDDIVSFFPNEVARDMKEKALIKIDNTNQE